MSPVKFCMQIMLYNVKGAIICLYTYRHVHKNPDDIKEKILYCSVKF